MGEGGWGVGRVGEAGKRTRGYRGIGQSADALNGAMAQ